MELMYRVREVCPRHISSPSQVSNAPWKNEVKRKHGLGELGASCRETSVKISTICRRRALKSCRRASENSGERRRERDRDERKRERLSGNVGTTPTCDRRVRTKVGRITPRGKGAPAASYASSSWWCQVVCTRQFIRASASLATGKIRREYRILSFSLSHRRQRVSVPVVQGQRRTIESGGRRSELWDVA